jgi:glycosyltransferase involved in cell wall biosynthesis
MRGECKQLKVALVAGTLGQGGAEKQLVYMARALRSAGVNVAVYSLTRGEFYETELCKDGFHPVWIGRFENRLLRLAALTLKLRTFRPHIVQSTHCFANLYAALAGRLIGAVSLGALRSSLRFTTADGGRLTRWSLTAPSGLITNSRAAAGELAIGRIVREERVWCIPNTIELGHMDDRVPDKAARVSAIFVGRLIAVKRLDCFLRALSLARRECPELHGIVVGDGPERQPSQILASTLGLDAEAVTFMRRRNDVPEVLCNAHMMVFCSDDEGFPNVLLEAMAARLPVITTPAGDAASIVQDGVTGYVVPFADVNALADRMVHLAKSDPLRHQLGLAGRRRVEQVYAGEGLLARRLLSVYRQAALQENKPVLLRILASAPVAAGAQVD